MHMFPLMLYDVCIDISSLSLGVMVCYDDFSEFILNVKCASG